MVFLGFVFFTVSTLAVHGATIDTDGCNEEYCTEKPIGYPQDEIDLQVIDQLDFFEAIKMESRLIKARGLEKWSLEGNCDARNETVQPYIIKKHDKKHVILQSKFFKQTIPVVKCTGANAKEASRRRELTSYQEEDRNHECFKDFILEDNFTAKCVQQTSTVQLYTWSNGKIFKEHLDIDSDCACLRSYDS